MMDQNFKKYQTLRVFEAFAGIGAQASALERMGINYKIVGISEWYIDAIECYAAIHCDGVEVEISIHAPLTGGDFPLLSVMVLK